MSWFLGVIIVLVILYNIGKNKKSTLKPNNIKPETLVQCDWKGKNTIESIRDDGYIIYKSNRVTASERKQIGFYGLKWYSENCNYCAVYLRNEAEDNNIGLVDVRNKKVLFKTKLQRPHRCRVTNTGLIVCEDWGNPDKVLNYVYVLDINGKVLLKKRHNSIIGDTFELIEKETKFRYNLNYSAKVHVIEL